jgi:hypothetical protein
LSSATAIGYSTKRQARRKAHAGFLGEPLQQRNRLVESILPKANRGERELGLRLAR